MRTTCGKILAAMTVFAVHYGVRPHGHTCTLWGQTPWSHETPWSHDISALQKIPRPTMNGLCLHIQGDVEIERIEIAKVK